MMRFDSDSYDSDSVFDDSDESTTIRYDTSVAVIRYDS